MCRFAVLLFALPCVLAQTAVFEVASVKPTKREPGEQRWRSQIEAAPAGLTIRSHTLRDCIQWAWSLKEYQLTGPAWIDSEMYDISAKASGPQPTDRLHAMLQALLIDRFRLAFHRENRELPVYALVPARGGAKLRPAQADTSDMARLPGPGLRVSFQRTSLPKLAEFLSSLAAVGRPVVDASGLDGSYDFTLDLRAAAGPWPSEAERSSAPSVSTVLEEQLGLKLDARKHAIDVMVIDRAQRVPSAN